MAVPRPCCCLLIPLSLEMWEQERSFWPLYWLTNSWCLSWSWPIPPDSSTKASFHSSDTEFSQYTFSGNRSFNLFGFKLVLGSEWENTGYPKDSGIWTFGDKLLKMLESFLQNRFRQTKLDFSCLVSNGRI